MQSQLDRSLTDFDLDEFQYHRPQHTSGNDSLEFIEELCSSSKGPLQLPVSFEDDDDPPLTVGSSLESDTSLSSQADDDSMAAYACSSLSSVLEPIPLFPTSASTNRDVDTTEPTEPFSSLEPIPIRRVGMKVVDQLTIEDLNLPPFITDILLSDKATTRLLPREQAAQPSARPSSVMVPRNDSPPAKIPGRSSGDVPWEVRFQELKEFVKKHGHSHVPVRCAENLALSKWCKRQRYQYKLKLEGKPSSVTDERQEKLNSIGFSWDVRCTLWATRFRELVQFHAKYGHCNVPLQCGNEYPKLGVWVKCQRRQYKLWIQGKNTNITQQRIDALNALGFSWKGKTGSPKKEVT